MDVKSAREFMNDALQNEGLRRGYRANIAMLIYDDQVPATSPRKTKSSEGKSPADLSTVGGCNSIAERLIDLIFAS